VTERRHHSRFLLEARRELRFRNLQGNVAVEFRIARLPDLAHTPGAQLRKQLIAVAELVAVFEFHLRPRGASINVSE
jgi:hypothetical protein